MRDSVLPPDTAAMRVTIITLDHHALGPVMKAEERLRAEMPGVRITAHAAAEWAENPEALEAARADVAQANIIVANLLFIDEHIKAILPFIEARRDAADAVVGCVSAQEVVAQTKMGELDMSVPSNGLVGLLKKLRGSKKPGASSSQKQMAILRRLPKILRFIPGKAQDLRAYFLAMQYWLAGSDDNVEAMLRFLVDKYATGERAAYRGALNPAAPVVYPDVGLYHPDLPERITEDADALPGPAEPVATVGLLLMRSYVLAGDTGHYDGVIRAFEAAGVKVVPTFAGGLDGRPAIETYLKRDGVACVDACVSLTGFSLVGGPAYNDSEAAVEVLKDLDLPYITAHPIEFQTLEQWEASSGGLSPVETTILVALPELDGGISPIVFGGRHGPGAETGKAMAPCPERIDMLVARATKLAKLRRSRVAERKVAVVLYGFPPNAGAIGTAAYMSVFESLFNTLTAMKAEGYAFDLPASVEALRADILQGNAAQMGQEANVTAILPADRIVAEDPYLDEIEAVWGPAPGKALSDGRGVFVLGKQYGNVMIGVQPTFGYEGDPMRLLFEKGFAPTHAFNGFYRYLRNDFGADAVLHFGMHGALEFMPGKQAGMSSACWPDRLIGDLPNIYLYAANNPSEGTLAKRRSNAILVSHLTPPVGKAGLYKGLLDLKDTLDVWRKTPVAERRAEMAETLQAQAAELDLAAAEPLWAEPEAEIDALRARLHEYEESLIPSGLHVVGKPPEGEAKADLLASMAEVDGATEEGLAEAARLISEDHEIPGLLRALGGHYIAPVPGGDLLRSPEILPTGRNIHAFDP
ncbi:MAG: magnesium chelatase subunit H, partial [Pseudomonadota bacterium]